MKRIPARALALICAGALLAGCGSQMGENPQNKTDKTAAGDTAAVNAEVAALLPTGAQQFTIVEETTGFAYNVTGYVNLDDCATEASGAVAVDGRDPQTFDFRRGSGTDVEAIRINDGSWHEHGDRGFPAPGLLFLTHIVADYDSTHRGIACAVKNLPRFTNLKTTANAANVNEIVLDWDSNRIRPIALDAIHAFHETYLTAIGAAENERAEALEKLDNMAAPAYGRLLADTEVVVETGEANTITFVLRNITTRETIATIAFTPTAQRDVSPVNFQRYLDRVAELAAERREAGTTTETMVNIFLGLLPEE